MRTCVCFSMSVETCGTFGPQNETVLKSKWIQKRNGFKNEIDFEFVLKTVLKSFRIRFENRFKNKIDFEFVLNSFWIYFEFVLNSFWIRFETVLNPFSIRFETVFNSFWIRFETVLKRNWFWFAWNSWATIILWSSPVKKCGIKNFLKFCPATAPRDGFSHFSRKIW